MSFRNNSSIDINHDQPRGKGGESGHRSPRGVLALLDNSRGLLYHSQYDPEIMMKKRRRRRRERHRQDDKIGTMENGLSSCSAGAVLQSEEEDGTAAVKFDHTKSEFTLFYFGASYCPYSIQFTPMLANFIAVANRVSEYNEPCETKELGRRDTEATLSTTSSREESSRNYKIPVDKILCQSSSCEDDWQNESGDHGGMTHLLLSGNEKGNQVELLSTKGFNPEKHGIQQHHCAVIQCICIPDASCTHDISKFCQHSGFFYPSSHHPNLSAIKMLLSISVLPTVVVVENVTGLVVTDWARTAIEFNSDKAVDEWRKGLSGAPLIHKLMCCIS